MANVPIDPVTDYVVSRMLDDVRKELDEVRANIARTRRGRIGLAIVDRIYGR